MFGVSSSRSSSSGVETSGEGAAARASAKPEARGPAIIAVAGAGSDTPGDAADRLDHCVLKVEDVVEAEAKGWVRHYGKINKQSHMLHV